MSHMGMVAYIHTSHPVKKVLYATYMLTVCNIYVTYMSSQHICHFWPINACSIYAKLTAYMRHIGIIYATYMCC